MTARLPKISLILSIAVWAVLPSGKAIAADGEPVQLIGRVSDEILGHLEHDAEKIRRDAAYLLELIEEILVPHIDTSLVARLVLDESWEAASPEQRLRFTEEFKKYLKRFYARVFLIYTGEAIDIEHFAVAKAAPGNTQAQVESRLSPADTEPVIVRYQLKRTADTWLVYDFSIDGVSLVETNRAQFASLISRDGLTSVIDTLTTRNTRPFR